MQAGLQTLGAPAGVSGPTRPLRRDVEGLRALAVTLVLTYHLGLGPPGGFVGVDVFFVVSGFVITGLIVREVERTGRLSLAQFYARRARRLLPAAGLVLASTAAATWLLAPRTERGVFGADIAGAAAYVVNWVFARRSVDYLAEDIGPSPVLHFWSLSVEEQFYLVWPLAVVALVWVLRRARRPVSRTRLALGLTALIIVPTLAASALYSSVNPARAFFVTPTRLWEMGFGALVALGATRWGRLRRPVAVGLGWAGLTLLVVSAVVVDGSTTWPGTAALLPTSATAAVIVAGFAAGTSGPERLLGTSPAVRVGALSYSLYLWHWPVLRVLEWAGVDLDLGAAAAAVATTVLLAWLSFRLVEDPIRHSAALRSRVRASLAVGGLVSLVGVLLGLTLWGAAETNAARRGERTGAPLPAARIEVPPDLAHGDPPPLYDALTPTPEGAPQDLDPVYARGCQTETLSSEVVDCLVGDPDGTVHVAVAGDSKMGQWASVIGDIGERRGWRVAVYTKSACPLVDATVTIDDRPYETCRTWGLEVLDRLKHAAPDVLLTTSVRSTAVREDGRSSKDAYQAALTRTWQELVARGTIVVAVSDTPSPARDIEPVYECVAQHLDDAGACTWPVESSAGSTALRRAAEAVDGAAFADLDPWVCPGAVCRGQYRNVLTYRQGSHVTATYASTLVGPVDAIVRDAVRRARAELEPTGG